MAAKRITIGVLSGVVACALVGPLDVAPPSVAAATAVYVSTTGNDANPGTPGAPVRTIARGVSIAKTGDSVVIHGGTYHESVQVYREDLTITNAPGEKVVLDGAVAVSGWTASGGKWRAPWTYSVPRITDSVMNTSDPMAAYPDLAFRDGVPLRQVASLAEVVSGTFYVDDPGDTLWVGDDPAGHLVEASNLSWGLYLNEADGTTVSGVDVRRYATAWSNVAAVRLFARNIAYSNATVEQNGLRGISVIGTNVTVDLVIARGNAYQGIHGDKATNVAIIRSRIVGNNAEKFGLGHSGAGIKFTTSSKVRIRNNYVADNLGTGVWVDIGSTYPTISSNLIERNLRHGIMVEITGVATVTENVVLDNAMVGIRVLESNNVELWNNAVYGSDPNIQLIDVSRETSSSPYRTAIALWDLQSVHLRNNVTGRPLSSATASLQVDDGTEKRSGTAMNVTLNHNAYWLPTASPSVISRWARWPSPQSFNATLAEHRTNTGQDARAQFRRSATNPFARSAATYDYRMPAGSVGSVASARAAAAMGVTTGAALPIGPRFVIKQAPNGRPGVVLSAP